MHKNKDDRATEPTPDAELVEIKFVGDITDIIEDGIRKELCGEDIARAVLTALAPYMVQWNYDMDAAPRGKTDRILVQLRDDIYPVIEPRRGDLACWNGVLAVMRHGGVTSKDVDLGWNIAGPVGQGGFPDSWIKCWALPPAPEKE